MINSKIQLPMHKIVKSNLPNESQEKFYLPQVSIYSLLIERLGFSCNFVHRRRYKCLSTTRSKN